MIRLKVFISSVQKELRVERAAIGSFLSTDDFLRQCTVPRIFEDYPQSLRPNPKAYIDLLRQCQIYLLIIGEEYGAHRDYGDSGAKINVEVFADRLVVSSPGHPPGGQTPERLASGEARSRARNPLVVQGLSWLELMDERGTGIPRMTRLLEQAGHPKPRFRIDHDCLVVELRPSEAGQEERSAEKKSAAAGRKKSELRPRDAILAEVRASGRVTTRVCVQRLGISIPTANRLLAQLVAEGSFKMEGSGRATYYRLT